MIFCQSKISCVFFPLGALIMCGPRSQPTKVGIKGADEKVRLSLRFSIRKKFGNTE